MIEAIVFDLDGTLVQTEKLKARSYAQAAAELCPRELDEQQVIEAFKELVGLSRREVASELVRRFDLEAKASARMQQFEVSEPWQAYVQVRLGYYQRLLDDPQVIQQHRCDQNLEVLHFARESGCRTGLATMSRRPQALQVLRMLDLREGFDFVASREDVEHGKPDPEIYLLVARQLGVEPRRCLVLEDSAAGVQAALDAGARCLAVTNEFSHRGVLELGRLEARWIVEEGAPVLPIVRQLLTAQATKKTIAAP